MKLNGAFWIGFLACLFSFLTGAIAAQNSLSPRLNCYKRPGFQLVQGRCYYFSTNVVTSWDDAFSECQKAYIMSLLVQIDTEKEWKVITDYLTENGLDNEKWWIGATNRIDEEEWLSGGSPLQFDKWCKSKPTNNETDSCAFILRDEDAANKKGLCWSDYSCTENPAGYNFRFICEYN